MKHPLLVTDHNLASRTLIENALTYCREASLGCGLFSQVQGNPVGRNVEEGVRVLNEHSHDGVIAMGGGSTLDAGKAIAFMAGQERALWDFEDREDWYMRADEDAMLPVVAVPTTAGTGSEVGRASVIIDEREHVKKIIFHPRMLPQIVILDPELTLGLPADITAWVGMDALSHNLEAFCSPLFHPLAHGIAIEGIRLVKDWLPRAVADGNDIEARAHMLVASTMGATAFQKGLGAMHALSHPVGAVLDGHHGLTNAIVMPYVLTFNRKSIDGSIAELARYLSLNDSFDGFYDWVVELRELIKIPETLSDIGVQATHIERLAPMAAKDPSAATNPRAMNIDDAAALYRQALGNL